MKKVEVLVQRNFVKEATAIVEVPSNLSSHGVREYLINKYEGTQALEELFEGFRLQHDQTTLQDVQDVEKEYKIKWEVELSANTPKEAAKLALEMIQSSDSTAKVFNVDGVNVDLCANEIDVTRNGGDELTNIIRQATQPTESVEPNKSIFNKIPKELIDYLYGSGNVRARIFELLTNGDVEFYSEYIVLEFENYKVYLYLNENDWRTEIVENVEVTRGEFGGIYYIIDKK